MQGNILRAIVKFAFALSLIGILLFPLGCTETPAYTQIDLANLEPVNSPSSTESSQAVFRVAGEGVFSPAEALQTYEKLISYLSQELNQPVELVQRRTYTEINDMVKSRYVDIAFVCGFPYVSGHEDFGMEILVVPEVAGETVYYSYIIVPADSDANSLEDLKGKTFAFADPLSNSGRLVPTYMLYQMGETPDNFFDEYIFTYSHDNSIRAVAEKLVEGAAVDSLVYNYIIAHEPDIAEKTRIIRKSPPFGIPPVVVHPELNQDIKSLLRGIFLHMNRDEAGQEILRSLMIDRFVLGKDDSYDTIREMANELEW